MSAVVGVATNDRSVGCFGFIPTLLCACATIAGDNTCKGGC
jgi:hypothetical protein